MIEILESGFFTNFVFQLMNRAGGFDRLDAATGGANQVVAVLSRNEKREIGGALVEAEAADHAVLGEALEQSENGGLVALVGEALGGGELG